jgi:hypothetical protein
MHIWALENLEKIISSASREKILGANIFHDRRARLEKLFVWLHPRASCSAGHKERSSFLAERKI